MKIENSILRQAALNAGIGAEELAVFFSEGKVVTYQANEWIFQESTPRLWAGVILEGDLELVRGLHGASRKIGTMIAGALIAEGAFLEGDAHSNGAFTRNGVKIWQISRERIEDIKANQPELFYKIVSQIAVGINRRLRVLSNTLYQNSKHLDVEMSGFRQESDSLGTREISDSVYYGVQTQRALENFPISGVRLNNFDHMIEALAMVKKAAALANYQLGRLDEARMKAICGACDEILDGKLHAHFQGRHVSGRCRHINQHECQ